jgi:hypothetical protein
MIPMTGGCTPLTCQQEGLSCGPSGDGCGGTLNCGTCTPPQTCGGGGVPGVCGAPMCSPITCAQQNLQCGPTGDGCGNVIQCGMCTPPQQCGGGGTGMCGVPPDGGACIARTCMDQGLQCGMSGDGCGNLIDCGACPNELTCGGGGTPGVCGKPACTPTTCATAGANCGTIGDGCGGTLDCGTCTPPATCGGSGMPFKCGTPL